MKFVLLVKELENSYYPKSTKPEWEIWEPLGHGCAALGYFQNPQRTRRSWGKSPANKKIIVYRFFIFFGLWSIPKAARSRRLSHWYFYGLMQVPLKEILNFPLGSGDSNPQNP